MRKILKALALAVSTIVLALGVLVASAFVTEHKPGDVEVVQAQCEVAATAPLQVGAPFTLVSWNVQYGAGRDHRFFYDGGDAVHVPWADVDRTVSAIGEALRLAAPDVVLLQEIDRGSKRTHDLDMLTPWATAAETPCTATAPYHRVPFVPKPFTNPLGRVDMHLGILSRAPLANTQRIQLSLLNEPRVVQIFNLKRALLTGEIEVDGLDVPLKVAVTHLSAFSFGDGTLERQVAMLRDWMASQPEDQPWVLAGDLNLLPPGEDKRRLRTERDLYADEANPLDSLIPRFNELFGASGQLAPETRTYLPFGYDEPDRKIDYVFYGGGVEVVDARVMREHSALSDHLPVWASLRIGPAPAATAAPDDPTDDPAVTPE